MMLCDGDKEVTRDGAMRCGYGYGVYLPSIVIQRQPLEIEIHMAFEW